MSISKAKVSFRIISFLIFTLFNQFSYGSGNNSAVDTSFYFNEVNGLVVAEIESLTPAAGWIEKSDRVGFSGTSFFEWTSSDQFSNPGNGTLNYTIKINSPGTYRFQWRCKVGHGSDNTEANDSWLRIPDAENFYAQKSNGHIVHPHGNCTNDCPNGAGKDGWFKLYSSGTSNWTWTSRTSDNDAHTIYAKFVSAGYYTIQISGRSKHHLLDRFILHKTSVQNPTSLNHSETKEDNRNLSTGKVIFKTRNSDNSSIITGATVLFNRKRIETDGGGSSFFYNIKKDTYLPFAAEKSGYDRTEGELRITGDTLVYIDMKEVVSSNQILINKKQTLNVFPNPASDIVFLKSQYEIKYITVYNIVGIKILDQRVEKLKETSLNIAVLKKGIYFLKVQYSNHTQLTQVKIIKD